MSTAHLRASLALWTRRLTYRRSMLARARREARSGAGNATPGVLTPAEVARIRKWRQNVTKAEALVTRRQAQIAARTPKPSGRRAAVAWAAARVGITERPAGSNRGPQIDAWQRTFGFRAVPWCFAAGTLISTPDGLTPIESLSEGDTVHSATGAEREVLHCMSRDSDDCVRLVALGLDGTLTTPEHPYMARRRLSRERLMVDGVRFVPYSEPEWVPAGELRRGDLVALPKLGGEGGDDVPSATAYITGRWLADGWVGTRPAYRGRSPRVEYGICDSHDKRDELAAALDAAGLAYSEKRYPTSTQFMTQTAARVVFEDCGKGAAGKRLPPGVMGWSRAARHELLRGYLDGDGCRTVPGRVSASSVSRELLLGIAMVARSLGHQPTLRKVHRAGTHVIEGRTVNIRDLYVMDMRDIGSHEVKEDKLYLWSPVRSVTPEEGCRVYNLTVADEHTFIADGVATHNCGLFDGNALQAGGVRGVTSRIASVALIEADARAHRAPFRGWSNGNGVLPGDLVVIGGRGVHVELVVARQANGSCVTIGGNTSFGSGGSQANGGAVARRHRSPREITGYALVNY